MARTVRTRRTRTRSTRTRAVAVTGAVAVVALLAAGCASAGDDKDPEQRSFELQGRTLTVDSDDSALELVVADSDEADKVEVTRWFQGSVVVGGDPKVTWKMDDDRLVLRLKCSGVVADCSAKHRIVVPRGVAVTVKDGDGSVRAQGFKDALNIRTGDGSVRVTDSSGALNLRTSDGSVRVTGSSGPLNLRTSDGSIHADGVDSRRVQARTGDGSVRLELDAVPDLVETRTGDGSVTIALPQETYRVTTETGDGSVDVSVPRADASSHVVSAHTGDGKITVRTAN
ncbi:DUF4097 family beta strand repeat-containing protein [Streptomyces sp. NBC_00038]|uniref:DUF4097 family beta strand repeat-containing protein n=1 Tax=Streptomyces sp. NBC_00038 TaxID=2903615 RepID=UPI002255C45F|nr:DUF4097 family beta strand repeat-containing protein [Streptomyces sp. NBC_00038]MCX5557358.1 DUF4097 domain-containing protein [Streptomyces sp. NBC_00038]